MSIEISAKLFQIWNVCCILIKQLHAYIYMWNIIKHNEWTSMNERTHFFIKIYLSHTILERVDVGRVWEESWRRRQTATNWTQVLLTIAALLSHSGRAAQPWATEGLKPSVCKLILTLTSCPSTDYNSNWNWLKPSFAPGYVIDSWQPASAVPPLIYIGACLDWRISRGSIYNTCWNEVGEVKNKGFIIASLDQNLFTIN